MVVWSCLLSFGCSHQSDPLLYPPMQRRIPHPSSCFGRGHGNDLQVLETVMAVAGLGLGNLWLLVMCILRPRELGVDHAARVSFEQVHRLLFQVMELWLDHEGPCHRRAYERHLGVAWVWVIAESYARGLQRRMWSVRWAEAYSGVRRVVEVSV